MHVRSTLHALEATKVCIHPSPCRLTYAPCMHVTWMLCEHALSYLVLFRQMNTCNSCYVLASFPGPAQLSVTSSTVRSILKAMESWAGPGNIPYWKWQKAGRGLGTRLLCACCLHVHVTCAMHMLHARAWHMLHVWLHVVMYIQEHIRTGNLSKSVPLSPPKLLLIQGKSHLQLKNF